MLPLLKTFLVFLCSVIAEIFSLYDAFPQCLIEYGIWKWWTRDWSSALRANIVNCQPFLDARLAKRVTYVDEITRDEDAIHLPHTSPTLLTTR